MHENREISNTPWSDDQGRFAKAINRTADMHVLEKSDCAVGPVNQPNKEGKPSTEVGEERARTRENIVPTHMHPTRSGKRMSQGLDGVRKAARERRQERFTALLHHLNIGLLRDSFYALKRQASPGVDGVRWEENESGLEERLVDLHSRVHRGTYRAHFATTKGTSVAVVARCRSSGPVCHRCRRWDSFRLLEQRQRLGAAWARN